MKILIVDCAGFQMETRRMLIEEALGCEVDTAITLGELYQTFEKEKYQVVVVDHAIENGQECVNHILETDRQQALLIVSNAIRCVFQQCRECVESSNVRRLYNPTPIKNILRMIEGFDTYRCDHYDEETDRIGE